jgi:enhancer of yellow 2 transcription factor
MSGDLRTSIHLKLVESGEKEKLKDHLRMRLIECGWRDQLKLHAKDVVREKGLERIKLEELVKDITPKGRALVPDSVKRELLVKIKDFLAQQQNI